MIYRPEVEIWNYFCVGLGGSKEIPKRVICSSVQRQQISPKPWCCHCWYDVFMLSDGSLFTHVLTEQFNLIFICWQIIFSVPLWNVKVLYDKLQAHSIVFLVSNSFLCGVLPWALGLFNVLNMFDSRTKELTSLNDSFKPSAVTLGFVLTSLCILRCAFEVTLARCPLLQREATVVNHFHLCTICPTVDWWISKLLEITLQPFPALCKSTTLDCRSSEMSFFCKAWFNWPQHPWMSPHS